MRPFYQIRTYYSDCSVQELTDILRAQPTGQGSFWHKLDKETDKGFKMKAVTDQVMFANSFVPVVEIQLQEENDKTKVTLTCRLHRFCEISAYVYIAFVLAFLIGICATVQVTVEALFPLLLVVAFFVAYFGIGTCATFAWYRKKFIRELKLTPIDKNS